MRRSKRYQANKNLVEKSKLYAIDEAVKILQAAGKAKFDESVEMHCRLNVKPEKTEQQVRGNVDLPHGSGKTAKVAVFSDSSDDLEAARKAGAEIIGGESLIEEIRNKRKLGFGVAVATPEIMPKLAKIAKILGPKGLMPSPKTETVTKNVKKTVEDLKKGKITFKSDNGGNIHVIIGKVSFKQEQLIENYQEMLKSLKKSKPASVKGALVNSITLSTTMGPGIKLRIS
ncbi:MAG: 50S ribosomal protein L1 [Candidatus Moranbacteria bacterium]|nr:50S ribosomal protein L1 [Candidatus Moranbacteria bacterium]